MAETYLGNPNLKSVGQSVEWTEESVKEYRKCMEDPQHFIENYVKVIHVDKGLIRFDMYPYQKKMIDSFEDNPLEEITTYIREEVSKKLESNLSVLNIEERIELIKNMYCCISPSI